MKFLLKNRIFYTIPLVFSLTGLADGRPALHLKSGTQELESIQRGQYALFQVQGIAQEEVIRVIQFKEAISEKLVLLAKASNLEVLRYLPDQAWVVQGTLQGVEEFTDQSRNAIYAVSAYEPSWKLGISGEEAHSKEAQNYVVQFFPKQNLTDALLNEALSIEGLQVLYHSEDQLLIRATPRAAARLASIGDEIEWIERAPELQTFDFKVSPHLQSPLVDCVQFP